MKNLFTFFFILISVNILAAIRFVDPNLSSGNGTTHFNTVASAVAASQDGDEIVLTAGTYNENTLAISTSIKLYPQNVGDAVTFNFDINVTGKAGLNIEIFDINFGSMYSQNSGSWSSNRPKVYITESSASSISLNHNYWDLYLFQSSASDVTFKSGAIVKSSMSNLYNYDDAGTQSGRTKIIANSITNDVVICNDSRYVLLANNSLKNFHFKAWRQTDSEQIDESNLIINNTFNASYVDFATNGVSNYNIKFCNNDHTGTIVYRYTHHYDNQNVSWNYDDDNNYFKFGRTEYSQFSVNSSPTHINLVANDGHFEWSYNTFTPTNFVNSSPNFEQTFIGGSSGSDTGHPSHFFYDIDMTRNDVGTVGGPYSTTNYPTSSGSAKAYIYYLDMPTDLFPNDNIQINAEGYHKN